MVRLEGMLDVGRYKASMGITPPPVYNQLASDTEESEHFNRGRSPYVVGVSFYARVLIIKHLMASGVRFQGKHQNNMIL